MHTFASYRILECLLTATYAVQPLIAQIAPNVGAGIPGFGVPHDGGIAGLPALPALRPAGFQSSIATPGVGPQANQLFPQLGAQIPAQPHAQQQRPAFPQPGFQPPLVPAGGGLPGFPALPTLSPGAVQPGITTPGTMPQVNQLLPQPGVPLPTLPPPQLQLPSVSQPPGLQPPAPPLPGARPPGTRGRRPPPAPTRRRFTPRRLRRRQQPSRRRRTTRRRRSGLLRGVGNLVKNVLVGILGSGGQQPGGTSTVQPGTAAPAATPRPGGNLGILGRAINLIGQQVQNLRNLLEPVNRLVSAGVSLLNFQTTPEVIQEGMRAVNQIQETARRVSQGQQPPTGTEAIYPAAINSILNNVQGAPTAANGGALVREGCPAVTAPHCPHTLYRKYDGTCNNAAQPTWGQHRSPLIRIVANTYADGVLWPRVDSVSGHPLPSARLVSQRTLSVHERTPSRDLTLAVMQWGQFVDHDITHVPVQSSGANARDCCTGNIERDQLRHIPECFPIDVAADDPFYRQHSVRCMNFLRSIPALGCRDEPAQQLNQITHWMDGSNVYGSSEAELRALRTGSSRLMSLSREGRLPRRPHGTEGCIENAGNGICYRAGDSRVNEQIGLTVMHNVWVMMHNWIADQLHRFNRPARNEDKFQEARAITVALMQHITYAHWLPIVVGQDMVNRLQLSEPGDYRADVHPGIVNEFSTAAFRFGHSLIAGAINVDHSRPVRLSDVFFDPGARLEERGMRLAIVRSLFHQPSQDMDTTFTREVIGRLFRGRAQHGFDLAALNVQRGRDHGTASYAQMHETLAGVCPWIIPRATLTTWQQLHRVMTPDQVQRLRTVYTSVRDVDLFIGGMCETALPGAVVGPTFACLIAEQFTRLKYADRYFYNHRDTVFSPAQLQQISSASLASVFCTIFPNLGRVRRNVFFQTSRVVSCDSVPPLDMRVWESVLPRRV